MEAITIATIEPDNGMIFWRASRKLHYAIRESSSHGHDERKAKVSKNKKKTSGLDGRRMILYSTSLVGHRETNHHEQRCTVWS